MITWEILSAEILLKFCENEEPLIVHADDGNFTVLYYCNDEMNFQDWIDKGNRYGIYEVLNEFKFYSEINLPPEQ